MPRFTEFDFGVSWVMGFFHQDWIRDGDTAADVVAGHLSKSADEEVLAVRRDACVFGRLPSATLEVLWDAGAQYMPNFVLVGGGVRWTRTIVGLCDERLLTKADVRPLTGADTEDGTDYLDAVVAEIEGAQFLEAGVRQALTDCASRCTPDLAFRVLLRAIRCAPAASLSSEQYTRLEAIGSAMRYGEFVVDFVKHLIDQD